MGYDDVSEIQDWAWDAFYAVLQSHGWSVSDLQFALDSKDCFNDVTDAVIASAPKNKLRG